jgi:hypothetical protein
MQVGRVGGGGQCNAGRVLVDDLSEGIGICCLIVGVARISGHDREASSRRKRGCESGFPARQRYRPQGVGSFYKGYRSGGSGSAAKRAASGPQASAESKTSELILFTLYPFPVRTSLFVHAVTRKLCY